MKNQILLELVPDKNVLGYGEEKLQKKYNDNNTKLKNAVLMKSLLIKNAIVMMNLKFNCQMYC